MTPNDAILHVQAFPAPLPLRALGSLRVCLATARKKQLLAQYDPFIYVGCLVTSTKCTYTTHILQTPTQLQSKHMLILLQVRKQICRKSDMWLIMWDATIAHFVQFGQHSRHPAKHTNSYHTQTHNALLAPKSQQLTWLGEPMSTSSEICLRHVHCNSSTRLTKVYNSSNYFPLQLNMCASM